MIFSYSIPYIYITAVGISLILAAAGTALGIYNVRKNKQKLKGSGVDLNFEPALPLSNIIRDKKRRFLSYGFPHSSNRGKYVLRLQEISSGREYNAKLKKTVTMGRKRTCGIRINDASAAPVHCIFLYRDRQLYIEDNNTLNGTIVNGILINEKVAVFKNDLILIGNREYKIEGLT